MSDALQGKNHDLIFLYFFLHLICVLAAGVVPPIQPASVGNSLDVGQPLLENRRTTTPVNEESTQGDDVECYASPVNRSSMSESDSNFLAQSDIQTMPVQYPILGDTGKACLSYLYLFSEPVASIFTRITIDVAASMSAESNSSSSA